MGIHWPTLRTAALRDRIVGHRWWTSHPCLYRGIRRGSSPTRRPTAEEYDTLVYLEQVCSRSSLPCYIHTVSHPPAPSPSVLPQPKHENVSRSTTPFHAPADFAFPGKGFALISPRYDKHPQTTRIAIIYHCCWCRRKGGLLHTVPPGTVYLTVTGWTHKTKTRKNFQV